MPVKISSGLRAKPTFNAEKARMKFAIGCKASELLFEFFSSLFLFGDLVCCDILLLLLNQQFIAVISTVHPLCMQLVKYPLQGIILLLVNFSSIF